MAETTGVAPDRAGGPAQAEGRARAESSARAEGSARAERRERAEGLPHAERRARTERREQRRRPSGPPGDPLALPEAGAAPPDADAALPEAGAAPPAPDDPVALGPDADAEEVARKILLDQLTAQARSRAELAQKLARRRVPDEVAERLLDRFEEVGLIDDAAFARAWVESRQPGKGLGRRALAQELRRKGIDDDVARAALDEVEPEDEEAAARALVRRKLRTMRGVDRVTATRRLAGMLARKGHGGDVVWRVVREELDALGHTGGSDGSEDLADLP